MPGLSFLKADGSSPATSLSEINSITFEDINLGTFKLNIKDKKFEHQSKEGSKSEITNFVNIVKDIFDAQDSGKNIAETKLEGKFATKDDIKPETLVPVLKAGTGDAGVYSKTDADTAFAKKDDYLKITDFPTEVAKKANVDAIFAAKDGKKSILVEKLGGFLDDESSKIYGTGSDKSAKEFLGKKGLKGDQGNPGTDGAAGVSPTASAVAKDLLQNKNNISELGKVVLDATTQEGKKFYSMVLESKDTAGKDLKQQILEARVKPLSEQVAKDTTLQESIKDKLAGNEDFKIAVKDKIGVQFIEAEIKKTEVVKAIFAAKDGEKSILVEKLGGFLGDESSKVYGTDVKKSAKEFLSEKGKFATKDDIKPEKLAEKANVEAIFDAKEKPGGVETIAETKLKGKFATKDDITETALITKLTAGNGEKLIKETDLKTKLAEKANVEAIFDAKDSDKNIAETKLGTTFAKVADITADALITKLTTGSTKLIKETDLQTRLAEKANVEAIFDAKDSDNENKNIAETKLETTFAKAADITETALITKLTAGSGVNGVYSKTAADTEFAKKANSADVYTKIAADTAFATKDDIKPETLVPKLTTGDGANGVYTKIAADTAFATKDDIKPEKLVPVLKAGTGDVGVYSKTAADTEFAKKANSADVYTKIAADTAFATKDDYLKTTDLQTRLAEKANVEAIFDAKDSDNENKNIAETKLETTFAKAADITETALITKLTAGSGVNGVYSKTAADTEFAKKANSADVYTKIAADTAFATKDDYLKTTDLPTKLAEKANVEAIFAAKDSDNENKNIAETKLETTFAKKGDIKAPDLSNYLETSQLQTKLAEKDNVEAITGSTDFTSKVYTKIDADAEFTKKANIADVYSKTQIDAFAESKKLPIDPTVLNPKDENDIPDNWADLI